MSSPLEESMIQRKLNPRMFSFEMACLVLGTLSCICYHKFSCWRHMIDCHQSSGSCCWTERWWAGTVAVYFA